MGEEASVSSGEQSRERDQGEKPSIPRVTRARCSQPSAASCTSRKINRKDIQERTMEIPKFPPSISHREQQTNHTKEETLQKAEAVCISMSVLTQRKRFRHALYCQARRTWSSSQGYCWSPSPSPQDTSQLAGRSEHATPLFTIRTGPRPLFDTGRLHKRSPWRITGTVWLPPAGKGPPSGACLCTLPQQLDPPPLCCHAVGAAFYLELLKRHEYGCLFFLKIANLTETAGHRDLHLSFHVSVTPKWIESKFNS